MKAGRKLSYDNDKADAIIGSVKTAKGSLGQVADLNNIPRETFYGWLRTGDDDRANNPGTELAQFSGRIRKEHAHVIIDMCEKALNDDKKSKFIIWWLSKICREDFGVEGIELKELRDIFKVILPLIGKEGIVYGREKEMDLGSN